ncbi:MAG: hypothetical protein LBP32_03480, partial [Spirochaetaceae bacterium]|nr:hypothetical protein [Spirochaetaceae bacterium]
MASFQALSRKIAAFLLGAVVSVSLFAGPDPGVLGFDRGVYDYHFGRADRELSPGMWIREARTGISLARSAWERMAAELYRDPELLAAAAKELDRWSEEELEARYTAWLLDRFFGTQAEIQAGMMAETIRELNSRLVYHTDEEGNPLYDQETGDPLIIRPGEGNYEEDLAYWRTAARETAAEGVGQYQVVLAGYFPELLEYIGEDRREAFGTRLLEINAEAVMNRTRELEGIIAREERLFIARRTGDVWSRRKKSEEEAAGSITAQLLEETAALCAEGIGALEARIEAAEGGTGDLVLAGEEWLAAYREQFERGLKTWEEAEERFFIRRIEWERESGEHFLAGEEAWSAAYKEFEAERRNWELQTQSLFEAGEERYKQASAELEKAIAEAKLEFEADARQRSDAGAERARAWVDMYVTCGTVLSEVRENVAFWLLRFPGSKNAPELDKGGLGAWVEDQLAELWTNARNAYERQNGYPQDRQAMETLRIPAGWSFDYIKDHYTAILQRLTEVEARIRDLAAGKPGQNSLRDEQQSLMEEEARFQPWYDGYEARHAQAVRELAEYEAAFRTKHAVWFILTDIIERRYTGDYTAAATALRSYGIMINQEKISVGQELRRWSALYGEYRNQAEEARRILTGEFGLVMGGGALGDILGDMDSEDFHLDEYQIELIRAQAVAGYWARRTAIAEAVTDYARELTAGRITDTESLEAWRRAKTGYDEALALYGETQRRLTEAGMMVEEARGELAAAKAALGDAEAELERLNREYSLLLAVYKTGNRDFILRDIAAKYQALIDEREQMEGDPLYDGYLTQARTLSLERRLENAGKLLQGVVAGTGEESPLAGLVEEAQAIISPEAALPNRVEEYGIAQTNPYYQVISTLLLEWQAELNDPAPGETVETIGDRYAQLVREGIKAAKRYADNQVESRYDILALLSAETTGKWYAERSGQADAAGLTTEAAAARLYAEEEQARIAYLAARTRLERDAVGYVLGLDAGEAAGRPAALASMEPDEARLVWESLDRLLALLEGLAGPEEAACREALALFAETGETGKFFLGGGSFYTLAGGIPAAELFLGTELGHYERNAALLTAYETTADYVPGREAEQMGIVRYGLEQVFAGYGLSMEGTFPKMSLLGAALTARGTSIGMETAELLIRLDGAMGDSPDWLKNEYESWKETLLGYMAAKAVYLSREPGISGDTETRLRASLEEQRIMEALLGEFTGPESALEEYIRRYDQILAEQKRLLYEYTYMTVYGNLLNEAVRAEQTGQAHWRTYITKEFLERYNNLPESTGNKAVYAPTGNPEGDPSVLRGAVSWREGILADAYEKTERELRKFERAFDTPGSGTVYEKADGFRTFAGEYLENPLLAWEPSRTPRTDYIEYEKYYSEENKLRNLRNNEAYYYGEIGRLGNGYQSLSVDQGEQEKQLRALSAAVTAQEAAYETAAADYGGKADAFAAAGLAYEGIYGETKR